MADEQRVLAMVQTGRISEAEGARLLAALEAGRGTRFGWRVMIAPMDVLSTRTAWIAATLITAASCAIARLGIRFDGALDLHRVAVPPAWSTVLLDAAVSVVVTAAVLWLVSLAVARRVRLVDFILAVALARMAPVVGGLILYLAVPRPREMEAAVLRSITERTPVELAVFLPALAVLPVLPWFIALLYHGFRTSSGLAGAKAGVAFTLGLVAAEVVSKLILRTATIGFLTATVLAQTPSGIAGVWSGAIEVPGNPLAIVIRLESAAHSAWRGTIDIPLQDARAVSLADLTVKPPAVSFRIPGAPGDPTIRVTLADDGSRMTGTFSQGGATLPVRLTRGESAAAPPRRPQMPAPPFPYAEEHVTYPNESAGLRLAGTFTRPRGDGRFPAVLLITGSGLQDRDETIAGHKPFLVLADYLTRRNVAVLRVDDRGVGGSDRGPDDPTSNDFAGDVLAGVAFLKARADVDPLRIGLIGHSEGAMLAAMAAAASRDVAFMVMLAGTGVPGDQILYSQAAALARASGVSDALVAWDRSVRERVFRVIKAETDGRANAAARQKLLDELAAQAPPPGAPEANARALAEPLLKAMSQPWLRFFIAYDPRQALAKVRVPVLAIGGERDVQVPPGENLAEIGRTLRANGNAEVTIVQLPKLNHLLQTSTTGLPDEYAAIDETIAPAALAAVGDWLATQISR
jgi:uncharacterized protein